MTRSHQKSLMKYLEKTKRCKIKDTMKDSDIICINPYSHERFFPWSKNKFFTSLSKNIDWITNKGKLGTLVKNAKYSIPSVIIENGKVPHEIEHWDKDQMYIIKPIHSCSGKGIKIVSYPDIHKYITSNKIDKQIIQPYIESKLINDTKFDIRLYVFMSHNGKFYVSKHGMMRFAYRKYVSNSTNIKINLTNTSIDKKNAKISKFSEWKDRENYSSDIHKVVEDITKRLWKKGKFYGKGAHIFGFDIMIDKDEKIRLIEVNSDPSMSSINNTAKSIKEKMVEDYVRFLDSVFE
jgi:hypothetical protein